MQADDFVAQYFVNRTLAELTRFDIAACASAFAKYLARQQSA
jgi:hypothetical protein